MSEGFWARRKAAVREEQEADLRAEEFQEVAAREEELAQKPDEEILQELGLPDPDTLEAGDDFKAFLTEAVPARLKTRALRRLWTTNPVLANIDGLVDYGEDFTDAACVIENLQTSYQVGKGMTRHVEEMARQATETSGDSASAEVSSSEEQAVESLAEDKPEVAATDDNVSEDQTATPNEVLSDLAQEPDEEEFAAAPVNRRMRFEFSGATEQI